MNLLLALFISTSAFGAELSETFSTRNSFVTGDAVWNQALGKIHPSLQVMNYGTGTGKAFDVGDGSHGDFDVATYANFSVGGDVSGNIIRLDLATYPILKVTKFHLAPGWRIEPVGDQPVVIYSLTTVSIEGEIHCEGEDGTNSTGVTAGVGGQGRCGGADGGNGGAAGANGANGADINGSVTGGGGGHFTGGAAVGGGGGGGWNTTSAPGNAVGGSVANGGMGGTPAFEPEFVNQLGGAGGGGGSGTPAVPGAGGGGGGGVVIIHAVGDVDIGTSPASVTGFIFANGGKGGTSSTTGGPGGGGGGGGVKVFTGGSLNIWNTDAAGASQAEAGAGGTNSLAVAAANGGTGRSWMTSVTFTLVGYYTPAEQAPLQVGNVEFSNAFQTVETAAVDLMATKVSIDSLVTSPVSGDFTFKAAGSDDNFATDDTGWTSNTSLLANKRYVKFQLTIHTSNVNSPTMIDSATLTYTALQREDFKLEAAGCGHVSRGGGGAWPLAGVFVILFALRIGSRVRTFRRPSAC